MRGATNYVRWSVLALVLIAHDTAQADNLFGGKNSIFNNPGQLKGGPNSVINNPGQLKGGPNSVINNPGQVPQGIANALNELQASVLTGPTLERAITESRNTAINGAMPIPPDVRRDLTGYASADSMNRVRYKVGDNGFANLAHLLEQGGVASAVTLIDVIVFRGPTEAADRSTWAHELTHVDQYRDWGVHSFAVQYARNWRSVEDPAYAKGNGYEAWAANNGGGTAQLPQSYPAPQASAPAQAGPQVPQQMPRMGNICVTNAGVYPGPWNPVGSPCNATTPYGLMFGRVGAPIYNSQ
jgi:hypothetical protein